MTTIKLQAVGKQFEGRWIFKDIDLDLSGNDKLAVTGFNGSGKSTLLQIIASYQSPSAGLVGFSQNQKEILHADWYKYISCGTPYMDFPEDLTLSENVKFFSSLKPLHDKISVENFAEIAELDKFKNTRVKYFSSGMKQRLKIALAILADCPVLLLDEPLSNLDKNGFNWYSNLMNEFTANKLVVICSNSQSDEIAACNKFIDINLFANK